MSTSVEFTDLARFEQALADVRHDAPSITRKSWIIAGHVDNNPNVLDVVAMDNSEGASLEGFVASLQNDQVQYGLIRLSSTFDMSTTVKFVYVHWIGDSVPFTKRGRFGVVHGSVSGHFGQCHVFVETGNTDELTEEALILKLDEASGTKNKTVEGSVEGYQMRGFTASQVQRPDRGQPRSVAPKGADVQVTDELTAALAEVHGDSSDLNWVVSGFCDGDLKKPLTVIATGTGGVDSFLDHLQDDQVMYVLYRTKDVIDDIETVKFVYIYWIGDNTKPLMKGKVSTFAGPVSQIFSPAHVSLSFTSRSEIGEGIINDKVMSSSGSKSHVK